MYAKMILFCSVRKVYTNIIELNFSISVRSLYIHSNSSKKKPQTMLRMYVINQRKTQTTYAGLLHENRTKQISGCASKSEQITFFWRIIRKTENGDMQRLGIRSIENTYVFSENITHKFIQNLHGITKVERLSSKCYDVYLWRMPR